MMFQGYKKQVNSASQSSLKNTGEQRGIKRSIRLCPAPLHAKTTAAGGGGRLGLLGTLHKDSWSCRYTTHLGTCLKHKMQCHLHNMEAVMKQNHGLISDFDPYRVGSFTFPAVWVEPFLLFSQGLGLHGVHPPLLALHLLPLVTQNDTNGSGVKG